jgi:Zn-dependent protease with chaperone function
MDKSGARPDYVAMTSPGAPEFVQSVPTPSPAPLAHPVLGPAHRETFTDAQHRNRRASWRFSLLSAVAVLVTGIPLCIVVTPVLFGVALFVAHVIDLFAPLPPEFWDGIRHVGAAFGQAIERYDRGFRGVEWQPIAIATAIVVVPGALYLFFAWLWLRFLFRRVGVGSVLQRLGARELNLRDGEEAQLANLVEEMAIAAGVRPPRVMLVDVAAPNVAATGLGLDDATILVTRGLLDRLDRDQTQAVIAHVIGSVGNGDLRILRTVLSVFQAWGLVGLIIETPFGSKSRKALWRLTKVALRRRHHVVDQWEAEFVMDLLLRGADIGADDDLDDWSKKSDPNPGFIQSLIRLPILLGFGMGAIAVKFAVAMSSGLLFGPLIALIWRARRYLADAMAVQLTRNPDAMGRALRQLELEQTSVPGGSEVSYLFVVWPATPRKQRGKGKSSVLALPAMHPSPKRRIERLRAMGSKITPNESGKQRGRAATIATWVAMPLLAVLLIPLVALLVFLILVALVLMLALTLGGMLLLLVVTWALLNLGFGWLKKWMAQRAAHAAAVFFITVSRRWRRDTLL